MKRCANRKCGDWIDEDWIVPLCPSCRLVGRWGVFLGGVLVGAVVAIMRVVR